jgi:hydrogenase/urease accessory protein HupE
MDRIFYGFLLALAILSTPVLAIAHPGHGHDDGMSIKHYLINYVHLLPVLLAAGIVVAMLSRVILKSRRLKTK